MGDTMGGHQLLNNAPCEQVLPPFSTSLDTIANMSSTEANPAVGKASRWYPAEDTPQRKKARKSIKPHQTRASLQPGAVLILLAGRFRGRRVILLKHLKEGTLLVTGPLRSMVSPSAESTLAMSSAPAPKLTSADLTSRP